MELTEWVKEVSQTFFHKPFRHHARFNDRLRTTGGRYLLQCHSIEVNPHHYRLHGEEAALATIKHELCHYHLHLEGRGFRHQDSDFKRLLKQVGGSRYCPDTGLRRVSSTIYRYQCLGCGHPYMRRRKMNTERYRCGICTGKLKLVETISALSSAERGNA